MEKREFLSAAAKLALLAPVGTLAADQRRFGMPASLTALETGSTDKLRLTLARASIPAEAWDHTANFVAGINGLVNSATARAAFNHSPKAYFESVGAVTTDNFEQSRDVALARLAMDTEATTAARGGDYVAFLKRVKVFGLPTMPNATGLTKRLSDLISRDTALYQQLKSTMENPGANPAAITKVLASVASANTSTIGNSAEVDTNVEALTDTVVVIAAVITLETIANTVVMTDIDADIEIISLTNSTVVSSVAGEGVPAGQAFPAVRAGFSALDANIIEGAATAVTAARLLGNTTFEVQVANDIVEREVEAIIGAMEQVGIVQIDPARRAAILQTCKDVSLKVYGLRT